MKIETDWYLDLFSDNVTPTDWISSIQTLQMIILEKKTQRGQKLYSLWMVGSNNMASELAETENWNSEILVKIANIGPNGITTAQRLSTILE